MEEHGLITRHFVAIGRALRGRRPQLQPAE